MSRTLKWLLGILAVLVIVVIAVGAVFVWQNRAQLMASQCPYAVQPNAQATPGVPTFPNGPRGFGNNGRNPMFGRGFGFGGPMGPMMGGRGRFFSYGPFGLGFFLFGGLLRLVIPLVVLALVAVIFYQLGKRAGATRHEPVPMPPSNPNPPQTS